MKAFLYEELEVEDGVVSLDGERWMLFAIDKPVKFIDDYGIEDRASHVVVGVVSKEGTEARAQAELAALRKMRRAGVNVDKEIEACTGQTEDMPEWESFVLPSTENADFLSHEPLNLIGGRPTEGNDFVKALEDAGFEVASH